MRRSRVVPIWLVSGLSIFPVLTLIGVLAYVLTFGRVHPFFWVVLGLIAAQLAFGNTAPIANEALADAVFVVAFWFVIGAGLGALLQVLRRRRFG